MADLLSRTRKDPNKNQTPKYQLTAVTFLDQTLNPKPKYLIAGHFCPLFGVLRNVEMRTLNLLLGILVVLQLLNIVMWSYTLDTKPL